MEIWVAIKNWLSSRFHWTPPADLGFQAGHAFIGYAAVTAPFVAGLPSHCVLLTWFASAVYMGFKEAVFDPVIEGEPLNRGGWRDIMFWAIGSAAAGLLLIVRLLH